MCFVEGFDGLFDSVTALEAGETDLSNTLMYKLLAICGQFLSLNEGKKKQVCWIERARSVNILYDEKLQLLATFNEPFDEHGVEANDGRKMAIGLHFRMKGINNGEPKSIKTLRTNSQTLF